MTTTGGQRSLAAPWLGGASSKPLVNAGYRSMLAPWLGGASSSVISNGGNRSCMAFWLGGAAGISGPLPPPSVVLLGGGPKGSRWNKKKHEYFFTPAWHKFALETQELDRKLSSSEQNLHDARLSNQIQERDDFSAYELKAAQEISNLRIRRDWLIRQMQEEEVILSILQDLPPLH